MFLEARIDALESIVAIRRLIGQYSVAFDTRDRALLRSLFHEDAVMGSDAAARSAEGIDAIMAAADALWAKMPKMHHWVSEPVVEVTGDTAEAVTASHAVVVDAEDGPLEISGRYRDRLQRKNGRWLFARRAFEMRYAVPLRDWRPVMGSDLD